MAKNKRMTESNLNRVIELSYEMLELADHGDLFRTDDGCGILFGIIRDDAYKIRKLAEQELKKHDVRKNKKKQDSDSTI